MTQIVQKEAKPFVRCEALRWVMIPLKSDGYTGVDGKPGSIRTRQCLNKAQGELQGISLCTVHAGYVALKRLPVYLTDGRAFDHISKGGTI